MENLLEMIPEGSFIYIMAGLVIVAVAAYYYFYLKPTTVGVDVVQEMQPVDEVSDMSDMIQEET